MSYRNSGAQLGGGGVLHKNENLNDYLRHRVNYNMTLAPRKFLWFIWKQAEEKICQNLN